MDASRRLVALFTAVLLTTTACSPASSDSSASPLVAATGDAPAATPGAATPTTTPAPTPFAIEDGEPWIVYSWLQECAADPCDPTQGVYVVRPDGRDTHLHIERNPSNPWGERRIAMIAADGENLTFVPVPDAPGELRYGTHARMRPAP